MWKKYGLEEQLNWATKDLSEKRRELEKVHPEVPIDAQNTPEKEDMRRGRSTPRTQMATVKWG